MPIQLTLTGIKDWNKKLASKTTSLSGKKKGETIHIRTL